MHKQAGFASILLILLIGLALTTLVIGMVTSVRSLQDSSLTTHAQTQAQIKSAIGYQALTGLLKSLSATQIAQINNGVIKDNGSPAATIATYKVVTTTAGCPDSTGGKSYFCYDITAKSGGASSVVRAIYTDITIGGGAFNGSIFAGGLQVGHEKNLKGDQMIQVGGRGNGEVSGNGSNFFTSNQFFENSKYDDKTGGIRTGVYTPTTFLNAEELRSYANYIFYADGKCAKNNLYSFIAGVTTDITTETERVACISITGITSSGSGTSKAWVIDASKSTIPVGVLWFEGEVTINLSKNRDLVNTIIATKDVTVSTDTSGAKGSTSNAYAPYHYNSESSTDTATKKARICGSSSTGIPTQYCDNTAALKALNTEIAKIANILFLTNGAITFDAKKDYPMNLYGNMLGIRGTGGTGAASGKFTGNGDVNIKGNLTFTGLDIQTTTNGTVNIKLMSVDSGGSATPSKKVMTLSGLRYM
ncbi:hypothetical protein [Acinetobacter terrae]|uniref:hypothetical protein n=1 Tax=Acinetobacter terrae TaxID=2731247 RepID=UPI0012DF6D42|nr:hypothetical protein [Acinetobacter terrae]